jgi:hypothetical protein
MSLQTPSFIAFSDEQSGAAAQPANRRGSFRDQRATNNLALRLRRRTMRVM